MSPFEMARDVELKAQLGRAFIQPKEATWALLPHARFVQLEPIYSLPNPDPPKEMEMQERYGRTMMITKTGTEGDARTARLRYVGEECVSTLAKHPWLQSITLDSIANHPHGADNRQCENGLRDHANVVGAREVCEPLADEVRRLPPMLERAGTQTLDRHAALSLFA